MRQPISFDYDTAFGRNIGWTTAWEQQILRSKRIAIAGMGGVGGIHLLTLIRLGIQNFHIADLDNFELGNFNRQVGAATNTLGKSKVDTLKMMAKDINPDTNITCFPDGVSEKNLDNFLQDVDLYIDGLDFFVLEIRQKIFQRCHELKIPIVTAAPLGMGVAYQVFTPNSMTFDEYYNFDPKTSELNQIKFMLGINPSVGHRSTIMACNLCASVAATEALKILLNRGQVLAAPWIHYFDAYRNVYKKIYLRRGNRDIVQRFRIWIANKQLNTFIQVQKSQELPFVSKNDLETILDFAKWTPSGDNSQPWQFEIQNANDFIFHFHNEDSTYDFAGKPSIMTMGFFIESFQIAASHFGYRTGWTYESVATKTHKIHFKLTKDETINKNPLFPFLKIRSVNRYSYKTCSLTEKQKVILEKSIGEQFKIHWFESLSDRYRVTKLNALSTRIRLSIPETYLTHKKMMDFENELSPAKVPIKASGVSPLTQKLLKFGIQNWERINFMNTFLGAAIVSQLEMDFLPGINCAAHYIIEWKNPEDVNNIQSSLSAGQALQRFWLQLTQLGLVMQPAVATIAFAYYGKNNMSFTKNAFMQKQALKLSQQLDQIVAVNKILFMGRVGIPKTTLQQPRSVRKNLSEIIKS
jgi:molybdopterin/thiamine biosynthesis adenylyltransferase